MKKFFCYCGQPVFFDSHQCVTCGLSLGYDPELRQMLSFIETENGLVLKTHQNEFSLFNRDYRFCSNREDYGVCNWLVPADSPNCLCSGCQFNRYIVNLKSKANLNRWHQFEIAKKRLLYTLSGLGLPVKNGFKYPDDGLLFDFIEDHRTAPDAYPESFVSTGFHGGVITINAMEADDAARESVREAMNESYRTLLGHLRHESGHYYWTLMEDQASNTEFVELFGNPYEDYATALQNHYTNPKEYWRDQYISAYASAHPTEDWAETWAHYLLIHDALETAHHNDLISDSPENLSLDTRIQTWANLSVTFNEISRSTGLRDTYPFVVTAVVTEKLKFIEAAIRSLSLLRYQPAVAH